MQHQRAHSDCLTLCLRPDRRHLPDDRTAPSGTDSPRTATSSTFWRWGRRSPLPPALPSTSELSFISRSVTPGKAASSSRRLTSPQSTISRRLTAGRMIHDTHTIYVFAHFCNTDVQLCRAQYFREKCGEWNQYLEKINCGIIITIWCKCGSLRSSTFVNLSAVHSRHDGCSQEHWSPTTTQLSFMAPSNR